MKYLNYLILTLVAFVLVSCEERTGYYDSEQQEIDTVSLSVSDAGH